MQKLLAILWWFVLPLAVWGGVASWACGQDSLEGGSWSGKITATADAPGSSLTDFFYVVQIDSSQTQFWAAVQNDGDDVRASVDGTQVPCWVDPATFNYAGQSCLVYVMRSGAASTAPVIRIYFGNAGASLPSTSATYGQFNTFPSSLKAFYPRGGGNDVTSNANNLTMTGSPTVGGVAGPISGSLATDYNGTSQYGATAATVNWGGSTDASFLSSVNLDSNGNRVILTVGLNPVGAASVYLKTNTNAAIEGASGPLAIAGIVSTATWRSLAATHATTSRYAYLNGTAGSQNTTSYALTTPVRIGIGSYNYTNIAMQDGRNAFSAVFNVVLSANWVAYWHSMLADPDQSDFYNGWTYSAISSSIVPLLQRMQLNMSIVRPTPWDRFVSLTPIMQEK